MVGVGIFELLILMVIGMVLVPLIVYWLIRMAVRDGTVDAHRRLDSESVRSQLRLGAERSPNSRP